MKNCKIARRKFFFSSRIIFENLGKSKKKKKLKNHHSKGKRDDCIRMFDVQCKRDEKWNQRADVSACTWDVNCISGWHETIEFVICRCPRLNRFHVKSISQRGKFVVFESQLDNHTTSTLISFFLSPRIYTTYLLPC